MVLLIIEVQDPGVANCMIDEKIITGIYMY